MEKNKTNFAVIVTGGFHSEGLTKKFKESGISFATVMPKINELGDKTNYIHVMQGERSFTKYSYRNLWDALARDYVAKVGAALAGGPHPIPLPEGEGRGEGDLQVDHRLVPFLLKKWRDRMIQSAIADGKIEQVGTYTKYVDALGRVLSGQQSAVTSRQKTQDMSFPQAVGGNLKNVDTRHPGKDRASPRFTEGKHSEMTDEQDASFREALDRELNQSASNYVDQLKALVSQKFDIFGKGLKELWTNGNITEETVGRLIQQMNSVSNSHLGIELALTPQIQRGISDKVSGIRLKQSAYALRLKPNSRAEVRSEEIKAIIALGEKLNRNSLLGTNLFSQAGPNEGDVPVVSIQVVQAKDAETILRYVRVDPMFGGSFASRDAFLEYQSTLIENAKVSRHELLPLFVSSPVGIRFRKAMAKMGVHRITVDLIPYEVWDDYDYAFAVRNRIKEGDQLYVSIPDMSFSDVHLDVDHLSFFVVIELMKSIRELNWGADALTSEGIIFQDDQPFIPQISVPRIPGFYLLLQFLKSKKFLPETILTELSEKQYPYSRQLEQMFGAVSEEELAAFLWEQLPVESGEPIYTMLGDRQTGRSYTIEFEHSRPDFRIRSKDLNQYIRLLKAPHGLELNYKLELPDRRSSRPFLSIDVSSLFQRQIEQVFSRAGSGKVKEAVSLIEGKQYGLHELIDRFLKEAAEMGVLEFDDRGAALRVDRKVSPPQANMRKPKSFLSDEGQGPVRSETRAKKGKSPDQSVSGPISNQDIVDAIINVYAVKLTAQLREQDERMTFPRKEIARKSLMKLVAEALGIKESELEQIVGKDFLTFLDLLNAKQGEANWKEGQLFRRQLEDEDFTVLTRKTITAALESKRAKTQEKPGMKRSEARNLHWEGVNIGVGEKQTFPMEGLNGSYEVFHLRQPEVISSGLGLNLTGDVQAMLVMWHSQGDTHEPLFLQISGGAAGSQTGYSFYADRGVYDFNVMKPVFDRYDPENELRAMKQMRAEVFTRVNQEQDDQLPSGPGLHFRGIHVVPTGWISNLGVGKGSQGQIDENSMFDLNLEVEPEQKDEAVSQQPLGIEGIQVAGVEFFDSSLKPFDGEAGRNRFRALYLEGAEEIAEALGGFGFDLPGNHKEAVLVFWEDREAGQSIPLFFQISGGGMQARKRLVFNIANIDWLARHDRLFFSKRGLKDLAQKIKTASNGGAPGILWRADFNLSEMKYHGLDETEMRSGTVEASVGYLTKVEVAVSLEELQEGSAIQSLEISVNQRSEARIESGKPQQLLTEARNNNESDNRLSIGMRESTLNVSKETFKRAKARDLSLQPRQRPEVAAERSEARMTDQQMEIWIADFHKEAEGIGRARRHTVNGSARRIVRNQLLPKGSKILSLGAWLGHDELFLAMHGYDVTATDFISEAVEHIAGRAREFKVSDHLRAQLQDLHEPLIFDSESFDAVYAHLSLHYLDQATLAQRIQEIRRILRPGGKVFVVVRSTDDWKYREANEQTGKVHTTHEMGGILRATEGGFIVDSRGKQQRFFDRAELSEVFSSFGDLSIEKNRFQRFKDEPVSTVFEISATKFRSEARNLTPKTGTGSGSMDAEPVPVLEKPQQLSIKARKSTLADQALAERAEVHNLERSSNQLLIKTNESPREAQGNQARAEARNAFPTRRRFFKIAAVFAGLGVSGCVEKIVSMSGYSGFRDDRTSRVAAAVVLKILEQGIEKEVKNHAIDLEAVRSEIQTRAEAIASERRLAGDNVSDFIEKVVILVAGALLMADSYLEGRPAAKGEREKIAIQKMKDAGSNGIFIAQSVLAAWAARARAGQISKKNSETLVRISSEIFHSLYGNFPAWRSDRKIKVINGLKDFVRNVADAANNPSARREDLKTIDRIHALHFIGLTYYPRQTEDQHWSFDLFRYKTYESWEQKSGEKRHPGDGKYDVMFVYPAVAVREAKHMAFHEYGSDLTYVNVEFVYEYCQSILSMLNIIAAALDGKMSKEDMLAQITDLWDTLKTNERRKVEPNAPRWKDEFQKDERDQLMTLLEEALKRDFQEEFQDHKIVSGPVMLNEVVRRYLASILLHEFQHQVDNAKGKKTANQRYSDITLQLARENLGEATAILAMLYPGMMDPEQKEKKVKGLQFFDLFSFSDDFLEDHLYRRFNFSERKSGENIFWYPDMPKDEEQKGAYLQGVNVLRLLSELGALLAEDEGGGHEEFNRAWNILVVKGNSDESYRERRKRASLVVEKLMKFNDKDFTTKIWTVFLRLHAAYVNPFEEQGKTPDLVSPEPDLQYLERTAHDDWTPAFAVTGGRSEVREENNPEFQVPSSELVQTAQLETHPRAEARTQIGLDILKKLAENEDSPLYLLSDDDLATIAGRTQKLKRIPNGTEFIVGGTGLDQYSDGQNLIFFVTNGRVQVEFEDGETLQVPNLPNLYGEIILFKGKRSATVRAVSDDVELYGITKKDAGELMTEIPCFQMALSALADSRLSRKAIANALRQMTQAFIEMSQSTASQMSHGQALEDFERLLQTHMTLFLSPVMKPEQRQIFRNQVMVTLHHAMKAAVRNQEIAQMVVGTMYMFLRSDAKNNAEINAAAKELFEAIVDFNLTAEDLAPSEAEPLPARYAAWRDYVRQTKLDGFLKAPWKNRSEVRTKKGARGRGRARLERYVKQLRSSDPAVRNEAIRELAAFYANPNRRRFKRTIERKFDEARLLAKVIGIPVGLEPENFAHQVWISLILALKNYASPKAKKTQKAKTPLLMFLHRVVRATIFEMLAERWGGLDGEEVAIPQNAIDDAFRSLNEAEKILGKGSLETDLEVFRKKFEKIFDDKRKALGTSTKSLLPFQEFTDKIRRNMAIPDRGDAQAKGEDIETRERFFQWLEVALARLDEHKRSILARHYGLAPGSLREKLAEIAKDMTLDPGLLRRQHWYVLETLRAIFSAKRAQDYSPIVPEDFRWLGRYLDQLQASRKAEKTEERKRADKVVVFIDSIIQIKDVNEKQNKIGGVLRVWDEAHGVKGYLGAGLFPAGTEFSAENLAIIDAAVRRFCDHMLALEDEGRIRRFPRYLFEKDYPYPKAYRPYGFDFLAGRAEARVGKDQSSEEIREQFHSVFILAAARKGFGRVVVRFLKGDILEGKISIAFAEPSDLSTQETGDFVLTQIDASREELERIHRALTQGHDIGSTWNLWFGFFSTALKQFIFLLREQPRKWTEDLEQKLNALEDHEVDGHNFEVTYRIERDDDPKSLTGQKLVAELLDTTTEQEANERAQASFFKDILRKLQLLKPGDISRKPVATLDVYTWARDGFDYKIIPSGGHLGGQLSLQVKRTGEDEIFREEKLLLFSEPDLFAAILEQLEGKSRKNRAEARDTISIAEFEKRLEASAKEHGLAYTKDTKVALFIGDEANVMKTNANKKYEYIFRQIYPQVTGQTPLDMLRISYAVKSETELKELIDIVRSHPRVIGAVATQPWKRTIGKYLDEQTERARMVRAVNHVTKQSNGRLLGDAIDGIAFINAYGDAVGGFKGKKILLLGGAGGAGRETGEALAAEGVSSLGLVETKENLEQAEAFAQTLRERYPGIRMTAATGNEEQFYRLLADADVLINASGKELPFSDLNGISEGMYVIDMVRMPLATSLLIQAKERGAYIFNGVEMALWNSLIHASRWIERTGSVQVAPGNMYQPLHSYDHDELRNLTAEEIVSPSRSEARLPPVAASTSSDETLRSLPKMRDIKHTTRRTFLIKTAAYFGLAGFVGACAKLVPGLPDLLFLPEVPPGEMPEEPPVAPEAPEVPAGTGTQLLNNYTVMHGDGNLNAAQLSEGAGIELIPMNAESNWAGGWLSPYLPDFDQYEKVVLTVQSDAGGLVSFSFEIKQGSSWLLDGKGYRVTFNADGKEHRIAVPNHTPPGKIGNYMAFSNVTKKMQVNSAIAVPRSEARLKNSSEARVPSFELGKRDQLETQPRAEVRNQQQALREKRTQLIEAANNFEELTQETLAGALKAARRMRGVSNLPQRLSSKLNPEARAVLSETVRGPFKQKILDHLKKKIDAKGVIVVNIPAGAYQNYFDADTDLSQLAWIDDEGRFVILNKFYEYLETLKLKDAQKTRLIASLLIRLAVTDYLRDVLRQNGIRRNRTINEQIKKIAVLYEQQAAGKSRIALAKTVSSDATFLSDITSSFIYFNRVDRQAAAERTPMMVRSKPLREERILGQEGDFMEEPARPQAGREREGTLIHRLSVVARGYYYNRKEYQEEASQKRPDQTKLQQIERNRVRLVGQFATLREDFTKENFNFLSIRTIRGIEQITSVSVLREKIKRYSEKYEDIVRRLSKHVGDDTKAERMKRLNQAAMDVLSRLLLMELHPAWMDQLMNQGDLTADSPKLGVLFSRFRQLRYHMNALKREFLWKRVRQAGRREVIRYMTQEDIKGWSIGNYLLSKEFFRSVLGTEEVRSELLDSATGEIRGDVKAKIRKLFKGDVLVVERIGYRRQRAYLKNSVEKLIQPYWELPGFKDFVVSRIREEGGKIKGKASEVSVDAVVQVFTSGVIEENGLHGVIFDDIEEFLLSKADDEKEQENIEANFNQYGRADIDTVSADLIGAEYHNVFDLLRAFDHTLWSYAEANMAAYDMLGYLDDALGRLKELQKGQLDKDIPGVTDARQKARKHIRDNLANVLEWASRGKKPSRRIVIDDMVGAELAFLFTDDKVLARAIRWARFHIENYVDENIRISKYIALKTMEVRDVVRKPVQVLLDGAKISETVKEIDQLRNRFPPQFEDPGYQRLRKRLRNVRDTLNALDGRTILFGRDETQNNRMRKQYVKQLVELEMVIYDVIYKHMPDDEFGGIEDSFRGEIEKKILAGERLEDVISFNRETLLRLHERVKGAQRSEVRGIGTLLRATGGDGTAQGLSSPRPPNNAVGSANALVADTRGSSWIPTSVGMTQGTRSEARNNINSTKADIGQSAQVSSIRSKRHVSRAEARAAVKSAKAAEAVTDGNIIKFYRRRRKVLALLHQWNSARADHPDSSSRVLLQRAFAADMAEIISELDINIRQIIPDIPEEIEPLKELGNLVDDAVALQAKIAEFDPILANINSQFKLPEEIGNLLEIDGLSKKNVRWLKRKLKAQLLLLRKKLLVPIPKQASIIDLFDQIIKTYEDISYEYKWRNKNFSPREKTVERIEILPDGKIIIWQHVWKNVPVAGGGTSRESVLTGIHYDNLEEALRSRNDILRDYHEDFGMFFGQHQILGEALENMKRYAAFLQRGRVEPTITEMIRQDIRKVLDGKKGLGGRETPVHDRDAGGKVLPLPGDSLQQSLTMLSEGHMEGARTSIETAQRYIEIRIDEILRIRSRIEQDRVNIYTLYRDELVRQALGGLRDYLKTTPLVQILPLGLESFRSRLAEIQRVYFSTEIRERYYQRLQSGLRKVIVAVTELEGSVENGRVNHLKDQISSIFKYLGAPGRSEMRNFKANKGVIPVQTGIQLDSRFRGNDKQKGDRHMTQVERLPVPFFGKLETQLRSEARASEPVDAGSFLVALQKYQQDKIPSDALIQKLVEDLKRLKLAHQFRLDQPDIHFADVEPKFNLILDELKKRIKPARLALGKMHDPRVRLSSQENIISRELPLYYYMAEAILRIQGNYEELIHMTYETLIVFQNQPQLLIGRRLLLVDIFRDLKRYDKMRVELEMLLGEPDFLEERRAFATLDFAEVLRKFNLPLQSDEITQTIKWLDQALVLVERSSFFRKDKESKKLIQERLLSEKAVFLLLAGDEELVKTIEITTPLVGEKNSLPIVKTIHFAALRMLATKLLNEDTADQSAVSFFAKATDIVREDVLAFRMLTDDLGDTDPLDWRFYFFASLSLYQKEYQKAINILSALAEKYRNTKENIFLMYVLFDLARLYQLTGSHEQAHQIFKLFLEVLLRLPEIDQQVHLNQLALLNRSGHGDEISDLVSAILGKLNEWPKEKSVFLALYKFANRYTDIEMSDLMNQTWEVLNQKTMSEEDWEKLEFLLAGEEDENRLSALRRIHRMMGVAKNKVTYARLQAKAKEIASRTVSYDDMYHDSIIAGPISTMRLHERRQIKFTEWLTGEFIRADYDAKVFFSQISSLEQKMSEMMGATHMHPVFYLMGVVALDSFLEISGRLNWLQVRMVEGLREFIAAERGTLLKKIKIFSADAQSLQLLMKLTKVFTDAGDWQSVEGLHQEYQRKAAELVKKATGSGKTEDVSSARKVFLKNDSFFQMTAMASMGAMMTGKTKESAQYLDHWFSRVKELVEKKPDWLPYWLSWQSAWACKK